MKFSLFKKILPDYGQFLQISPTLEGGGSVVPSHLSPTALLRSSLYIH